MESTMNKYYRSLIMAVGLAMMVGCQTHTGMGFFKFQPNDATITTTVHDALLQNKSLSSSNVLVSTTNRVVTLSGRVKTIRQSDTAEEVASKIEGVKSVKNDIIVRK